MVDKNRLAGKIVSAGLTQAAMAQKMGMSRNTFSYKINGKRPFDTKQIEKACAILGINSDIEKIHIFFGKSS